MPPFRVFISSRCDDAIRKECIDPGSALDGVVNPTLQDLRLEIKAIINSAAGTFGQERLFEANLHNDGPPPGRANKSWRRDCIKKVEESQIFLGLFNGHAGYASSGSEGVGICHDEFLHAMNLRPDTVRIIDISDFFELSLTPDERRRSDEFTADVKALGLYSSPKTLDAAIDLCLEVVYDATVDLLSRGVRQASIAPAHRGRALEWRRMSYEKRSDAMRKAIVQVMRSSGAQLATPATRGYSGRVFTLDVGAGPVLFVAHAVPDAMSVAAAREMVGQPFLQDIDHAPLLETIGSGPVHLIACQQGITQAQAQRLLGHPDAIVIPAPFGVYVADPVQRVQMILLAHCRDFSAVDNACTELLNWIKNADEADDLTARAKTRAQLVAIMASQ